MTDNLPNFTGRTEFRLFLILYLISLPLQAITTGSFIQQGSTALVVLTAIHAGVVAATFWALLSTSLVSTQIVEDGTLSSLVVSPAVAIICSLLTRIGILTANGIFYRCFFRCDVLHSSGCRPYFHVRFWPLEPAWRLAQYTSVRLDDDMARRVSLRLSDIRRVRLNLTPTLS